MTEITERMSTCPACGRSLRLTRAELVAGHGFCAACEVEFDIEVVAPEVQPAFREQALVVLDPIAEHPRGVREDPSDPNHLIVVRRPWAWARRPEFWLTPFSWPKRAGLGIVSVLTGGLTRTRDELAVAPDILTLRKQRGLMLKEDRVPIPDIATVTVVRQGLERHIVLATRGRSEHGIAVGLGHGEQSLTWIIAWLRRRFGA